MDNSSAEGPRSVHILQMGQHFLYLPIYYAVHRQFFGRLPPNISVVIHDPIESSTDTATYDHMIDETADYRDFVMAITDPIQIFRTPLAAHRKPAVLATLVTNAAFWAVNHRSVKVGGLDDLGAFDQVIAYPQGTTSYSIAARIARDSGRLSSIAEFVRVVSPGNELVLLNKLHTEETNLKTVALSPDILRIEEMESQSRAFKELALGRTQEYNDVIVTALVSTNDFVEKEEPLVQGILSGLHQALMMTRRLDADVIRYARSTFWYPDYTKDALTSALEASVLPLDITVEEAHWMSAARAYCEGKDQFGGFSQEDKKLARDYYEACIAPYRQLAKAASNLVVEPAPQKSAPLWWLALGTVPIATIGLVKLLGAVATLFIFAACWATWLIIWSNQRFRLTRALQWGMVFTAIILIAVALFKNMNLEWRLFCLGTAFALLVPALIELIRNDGDH